ncbi:2,5-diketo-D-gluconic acid reductase [Saccharospirillum sp. MSK14-1]|uniref:aldo/keto reductase n=1 Tax=Saccharospirillum sp. MSK14-1 TaxID=1897632 RepID=UPI000D483F35|nr:aldo/keto reductase [Saccharospirillum sp. MSK14-1]PTY37089.1 2,5-diketo-D-gluconic acid reductase [Saccharospirillum sp. MSK14-1]
MIHEQTYTLSNGVEIPKLGLGTWMIDDDASVEAVKAAIELGYRHIDTAQAYQNERGVGAGIKASGVDRKEIFVTTKLAAEMKSYQEAVDAIDESLRVMGLDYVDLMIIHSPQPWMQYREDKRSFDAGNREAWRALEDAYKAGKIRAIGLSNFEEEDIENILGGCTVKPMVHQILAHISNTPTAMIEYSTSKGMLVEAYSPVGHGELFKNEDIIAMAEKYGVSVPQLSIQYDLQLGLLPLPKTANPDHMKSNADLDFTISEDDMNTLKNMKTIEHYGDASVMPVFGGKL